MKLGDITPYAKNARKNDAAVDAVAESIRQCTYVAPIIVDEDGIILAGHTRWKAMRKLGKKEAEVLVKAGLTEEQKAKYRLLDNKTNELADWDYDLLGEELRDLDFGDLDLDWGVDLGKTDEVIEDEVPEVDELSEPVAQLGDIWQLGRHRLMCGDSTDEASVQRLCGEAKMDLLITDPPYNVDYTGKTKDALKIQNDKMGNDAFRQFLRDAFFAADCVMKPGAVFYIWHADSEGYNFRGACFDIGWKVRECLIWVKNSMVLGRQDYQWKHEPCLYGWKEGTHLWASDRKQTTTLNFDRPTANKIHPTMKPVKLFDYQICNNTKAGDAVLDLFGGSGTTIIACEQNGRTAYMMEYDPRYVDAIVKRWENLTGEKAVCLR
jgi:site-specific DNA-methyltransferase (adenine-specific)